MIVKACKVNSSEGRFRTAKLVFRAYHELCKGDLNMASLHEKLGGDSARNERTTRRAVKALCEMGVVDVYCGKYRALSIRNIELKA